MKSFEGEQTLTTNNREEKIERRFTILDLIKYTLLKQQQQQQSK